MAKGNKYLEDLDESLECETKLWRPFRRGVAYRNWNGHHWVDSANSSVRLPCLKDIRTPAIGEEFVCGQEWDNDHDRHAVVVHRDGEDVLGHLPREISSVAFFFLKHDGCITGKVTGRRRYCHQWGGMEIPCELLFVGKRKHAYLEIEVFIPNSLLFMHWMYRLVTVQIIVRA